MSFDGPADNVAFTMYSEPCDGDATRSTSLCECAYRLCIYTVDSRTWRDTLDRSHAVSMVLISEIRGSWVNSPSPHSPQERANCSRELIDKAWTRSEITEHLPWIELTDFRNWITILYVIFYWIFWERSILNLSMINIHLY